jgi:hypothetical protein
VSARVRRQVETARSWAAARSVRRPEVGHHERPAVGGDIAPPWRRDRDEQEDEAPSDKSRRPARRPGETPSRKGRSTTPPDRRPSPASPAWAGRSGRRPLRGPSRVASDIAICIMPLARPSCVRATSSQYDVYSAASWNAVPTAIAASGSATTATCRTPAAITTAWPRLAAHQVGNEHRRTPVVPVRPGGGARNRGEERRPGAEPHHRQPERQLRALIAARVDLAQPDRQREGRQCRPEQRERLRRPDHEEGAPSGRSGNGHGLDVGAGAGHRTRDQPASGEGPGGTMSPIRWSRSPPARPAATAAWSASESSLSCACQCARRRRASPQYTSASACS